jgi:hypothetical protein
MIHELAHYVSNSESPFIPYIGDVAYFHLNAHRYKALTNFEALRNADRFSQYAFEVIGRPDYRIAT